MREMQAEGLHKAVGLVQVVDLLVRYGKPFRPKNSSIYICSRG